MNYLKLFALFVFAWLVNLAAPDLLVQMEGLEIAEAVLATSLWCISLMLGFGWACSRLAGGTVFPSFTLQLLIGIVLHDALQPLSLQLVLAVVVCTALAALILKSGGDEIDRKAFLAIAWPTFMIAVVGYGITFFIMYPLLMWLGLSGQQAALLSAIIGSTDPAALIPTLKHLMFKHVYQRVVNVSVAESALNDAVGAIFTAAVAEMVLDKSPMDSVEALSQTLFSPHNLINLGQQFLFGCVAGLVGWIVMQAYDKFRAHEHQRGIAHPAFDFALLLFIPLATFLLAQMLHGNGFLAAFVAGLLANFNHKQEHFHPALQHTETHIESLAKPVIFMMVGPFVSLQMLADTAVSGFLVALMFILVARPVAVFVSLLVTHITLKEKLFLCVVRETGVIPVVLAVITVAQFPAMTLLMPLTAWVVIWTLTLLPAITPWWAAKLKMLNE
jgi:NhaP-type Na+/H+ or K+/H+ antiporter